MKQGFFCFFPKEAKKKKFVFVDSEKLFFVFCGLFVLDGVLLTTVTSPAFPFEDVTITVQTVVTPAEPELTGREALLAETNVRVIGATVFDILLGGLKSEGPGGGHDGECGDHPPEAMVATGEIVGIHVGIAQKRETACTARGHFFFLDEKKFWGGVLLLL